MESKREWVSIITPNKRFDMENGQTASVSSGSLRMSSRPSNNNRIKTNKHSCESKNDK
jgi:hypothetical protein